MTSLVLALLLALVACGGKKDPGSEGGSGATGSGSAGSGSVAGAGTGSATAAGSGEVAAAAPEAALPTEVDFEDDASARITEKNVDAELQAIENQLAP